MIRYEQKNVERARTLRKNMTPWERKLRYCYLKTYPVRYQRQKPVGNYILDFYCAKARLAVELDGGGHYTLEQEAKDRYRTEELRKLGVKVLRICNADVDRNFTGVCGAIDMETKRQLGMPVED